MKYTQSDPLILPQSRKYDFRIFEQNGRLRLVPLRWSTFTWTLFIVLLFLLFFGYKSLQIDVLWQKVVVIGTCTMLAAAFLFGILSRFFDGVVIAADSITYRYGLARRSIPMDGQGEVQVRQQIDRWVSDSDKQVQVTVQLWLCHPTKEHHIFDYHGHKEEDAAPMLELGERLKAIIQAYIQ